MNIHAIRLRGPWEAQSAVTGAGSIRIQFPCRWKELASAGLSDKLLLRRKFHSPTNLSAGDQVWLCFAESDAELELHLNGKRIATLNGSGAWEIRRELLPTNTLELVVLSITNAESMAGEIQLEIRSAAAST